MRNRMITSWTWLGRVLGIGIAALSLATGCSAAAPLPEPTTTGPGGDPAAGPGPIRLSVASTALGETVTSDGWTVYRFEADSREPPASLCENDCLLAWPPLLTDGSPPRLEGVDPALVGALQRTDGTVQITLAGWPLYRFVDDIQPGDTTGENVGGNWSAVGKDGKPLVAK